MTQACDTKQAAKVKGTGRAGGQILEYSSEAKWCGSPIGHPRRKPGKNVVFDDEDDDENDHGDDEDFQWLHVLLTQAYTATRRTLSRAFRSEHQGRLDHGTPSPTGSEGRQPTPCIE